METEQTTLAVAGVNIPSPPHMRKPAGKRSSLAAFVMMAIQTTNPPSIPSARDKQRTRGLKPAPRIKPGSPKFKRNEPCPCGSGKKFRDCHLTGPE